MILINKFNVVHIHKYELNHNCHNDYSKNANYSVSYQVLTLQTLSSDKNIFLLARLL